MIRTWLKSALIFTFVGLVGAALPAQELSQRKHALDQEESALAVLAQRLQQQGDVLKSDSNKIQLQQQPLKEQKTQLEQQSNKIQATSRSLDTELQIIQSRKQYSRSQTEVAALNRLIEAYNAKVRQFQIDTQSLRQAEDRYNSVIRSVRAAVDRYETGFQNHASGVNDYKRKQTAYQNNVSRYNTDVKALVASHKVASATSTPVPASSGQASTGKPAPRVTFDDSVPKWGNRK